jgi:hypothetical protein
MAAFSDNTDHRIVTSTHGGLLDHPGSFDDSVTAMADVVRSVRGGGAVSP